MSLLAVHGARALIWIIIGGNVVASAWGLIAGRRVGGAYWALLVALAVLLAVQIAPGVLLLAGGTPPRTWLHLVYGLLGIIGIVGQIGLRPGGVLRRTFVRDESAFNGGRFMALWCLTLAAALLRAYSTGLGR